MAVQMRQTEKDLSSFMPDKGNSNMAASVEVFAQNKPTEAQDNHVEGDKGSGEKEDDSEKEKGVSGGEEVDPESPQTNVGHKLLLKQGWQAGQGLGKQNQGQVEPIPIVVKQEQLGVGRIQMEMEQAEGTTERRRQLECEKADSEELQEKYKRNQEHEAAKIESVADLKANLHCDLCDKQYSRHADFDNHMSSQDHAHKQRLKTLRQREFVRKVTSQKLKESHKVEKQQRRINDFADARVKRAPVPVDRSPSTLPLAQVKADQPQSTVSSTPGKGDHSLSTPGKGDHSLSTPGKGDHSLSTPGKGDHSPSQIELPAPNVEKPALDIKLPATKIEKSSSSDIKLPVSNIELPASNIELPASGIELPISKIELPSKSPPCKTKLAPSENSLSPLCETKVSEVSPSQIELPPPNPSDIELPPSEIELFLSELQMAPAAIPPPKVLPTTVFYTDGSSDAPPLPAPCDDTGGSTPDGKGDSQHDSLEVKDSPGKSGVVSFTFAKKASTLLLPGAVFAKTGKKVPGKSKRGHENSGSESSPIREGYHSSPPLNCKAKPQLDFVRFVHSDGHTGAAKENTADVSDVNGSSDVHKDDDTKETASDVVVPKKLLEFHSVTSVDDTRQLPWPGEMVQHTHMSPTITYCCNPLYFDFTQLRARPAHANESHANGDVEEVAVEKKKSHKKHSKKSRSHRSRSERKKRKLLQHADSSVKTEDNGNAGDEHKAAGTQHKSKKHKHRKSKKSRKHRHNSIGDTEGVESEKKESSTKKHNEKEDSSVADGKKSHKAKKKKSHRSKKDKKSNVAETVSSEKSSVKDEQNKMASGKEKKKKSEKERKSCEEESSKESDLDEMTATADGKKKRKYRKRKHTANFHQDSSDDDGAVKTSKSTKKVAVPVVLKRKGISSTSELSDNAKETKLLEAKLQKNKKQKVNMVDAIVSSHVHVGDVKTAKLDCVLPLPPAVGAELVKALKPAVVVGTIGKMQHGPVVKSDDQNCDVKNKTKEVGKSKWDTSSDSDLDNAGPVMAKSMASLIMTADVADANKDLERVVSSHSNRSSVRSRKNSGQSEKAKMAGVHRSDRSNDSSAHEEEDKIAKRKGRRSDQGSSKHSRSRSGSVSSKRRSRSYSTDSKYEDGRSRSRSYTSDDYSDDYDHRRSHTRTPSRDRRRSRSHSRTPSRDRRWSRTPSRDRRRSHTRTPSRDSRRSRRGRRSYSSYSRSRSRSTSYSRRSRRRKSRSYSGGRRRRHRSYSRSYSRSRSRSSYSRSRSRSHSPVGSHGRHWPYNREHRYNSANVMSLLPKQKAPATKRVDVAKNQKVTAGDATKNSTLTDLVKKSESGKSAGEDSKASPSKDVSSTTVVDPSKIPTPTADTIPLPPSGKGKTVGKSVMSQQAESIPLPDAPADDNAASNIFQPIGPNDPLVFKVPLPPPPPPGDGTHAKGDSSMPPPPPLPDGVAPSGDASDGKTTDSFMIPPEQVERYKQLRQQAQIHARARILAQRRLEAGYENDSDEEDVEEEDPQQQLMLDTVDMQQMDMLPQQLLIPQQLASPQPMHHVMSLSPGGVPASLASFLPGGHTFSGLQPAIHMVPQAGAPVVVAAPSAGAGHLMHQMMPSNIVHVMGPGGVPIAVQQLPSQQQMLQQQLIQQQQQQQQQQLVHQQLMQQQHLLQQPMMIQAGGAPGLIHAAPTAMSVMPQLVPVAQQLPNGQVIVGQQLVMSRVMRPHM